MSQFRSRISSAAALLLLASTSAIAADADEIIFVDDANFIKPAELGSSWNLRGEIGYNIDGTHDVTSNGSSLTHTGFQVHNIQEPPNYSIGVG